MISYTNALGDLCVGEIVPGEGTGLTCGPPGGYFDEGPLWASVGARQVPGSDKATWSVAWVKGLVDTTQTSTATLVRADCTTQAVEIDPASGAFIAVVARVDIQGGRWPVRVEARNASGDLIGKRETPLDVPPTKEAKATGARAPQPQC